jgi:hypothetical protein
MPTPKALPRTLDAWIKQLDGARLPVEAQEHERIRRALGDSRRSMRDIAEMMQNSPAVALTILREANRGGSGLSEPAESLEVALTRVGLKRAEMLLNQTPILAAGDIPQALRQLQVISQHACQQANGLFAARLARLWQEIHWCSLLFLAPLWPLAYMHPQLFEAWERRVLGQGEPADKVERELLGLPVLRLCLAVAEHWRLPGWIVEGYRLLLRDRRLLVKALHIARDQQHPLHQQQVLDADAALSRWLTQPANTVLLANGLALSAHQAWDSAHHLRWQRLTGLYLHMELCELQQHIHRQAVQSARQYPHAGLWHPAEALLWPWSERHLHAQATQPAAPKPGALALWRQHCGQLLAEPSAFANLQQLTACARDALRACTWTRSLMLLADRDHTALQAQQIDGLPETARQLRLDPTQSQVLRRLLAQPTSLRLGPENVAQFSALLPGNLKSLFSGEHLLLRSLARNGKVVMLLVADQNGAPFSDASVQAFGKTARCIERALASFAGRGH